MYLKLSIVFLAIFAIVSGLTSEERSENYKTELKLDEWTVNNDDASKEFTFGDG